MTTKEAKLMLATGIYPNTWDKYTNERVKTLHPLLVIPVLNIINECFGQNFKVRITADGGYRSFTEQNKLYGYSRTADQLKAVCIDPSYAKPKEPWKTNAVGGMSYHNYGLAVDVCMIVDGQAVFTPDPKVVAIFKKYGFEWGGDWQKKDKPHFQNSLDHTFQWVKDQQKKMNLDERGYIIF